MSRLIGICSGASTISLVEIERNHLTRHIHHLASIPHEGNPKQIISHVYRQYQLDQADSVVITGRKFKEFLNLDTISEPQAVEIAYHYVNRKGPQYNAIISAGGETFMAYQLDRQGKISKVFTGNKCASGTGEFFMQQTRRMDVGLEEAIRFAEVEQPYHVSGRCSVFCKSDCTHATNIGIPKGQVVAGLSKMMAAKVMELLKNIPKENIMLIGGTTQIQVMVDYLRQEIKQLTVPGEATYFEALGAALWAAENGSKKPASHRRLFARRKSQFDTHPPLRDFENRVTFTAMDRGVVQQGDKCLLGLDVGSTTTKIVLLRASDLKILASEYLRTNGDPVGAARLCYRSVLDQLGTVNVDIRGLGVTGSGRQIAGLHALTGGVINEIIAHAVAALHFDPAVDTIFEIGGQDAKYTYITNGVASDYAMNEACSAGTGSFLEESAKETLGIEMEDIARWALRGRRPPNFNDQCAAFISSDIKNTAHEGIPKEDIVAGLVYSICMNYVNRVKGARPVGHKVFMQGGVCYNRAVPMAMAALTGKEIIVPPEPGLMGAFGVALEVKNRIDQDLMPAGSFDLKTLVDRDVTYKDPFKCAGGRERCDIGCSVSRIVLEGKTYPFGGACNLYYNIRQKVKVRAGDHDLVVKRQQLVYYTFAPDTSHLPDEARTVGISRSFLTNTYYPLFAHFFTRLGMRPVLPDRVDERGIDRCAAPFCFPCEISHGYLQNVLDKNPDVLFLPHIQGARVDNGHAGSNTCPLLQGESYYLRRAFEDRLTGQTCLVTPILDFSSPVKEVETQFLAMAKTLGYSKRILRKAFRHAWEVQQALFQEMRAMGRAVLADLEKDPSRTGVVLFGRPYNAYVPEANKGIPHKFASRGITVIPVDFLNLESYPVKDHMYWSLGQLNLKGAEFIKQHPQLFGTYITNFSCGPDSFVVGYFRDILGSKPSLTLELDNHTADAGLETRVEAFLDIVARYRKLTESNGHLQEQTSSYRPATSRLQDTHLVITTSGREEVTLFDPRVRLVFASMNQFSSQAFAAAYESQGIRTLALPACGEEALKLGRGNTMCKECLPLQLTVGSMVKYYREQRPEGEITVYFMPTADGPCRFGQYKDFIGDFIRKRQLHNITTLSMTSTDGYGGLGTRFTLLSWKAVVIADIFEDVYHTMLVTAKDRPAATRALHEIWDRVLTAIKRGDDSYWTELGRASRALRDIPYVIPPAQVPKVLVVGEIYVRKEGISRRWLPEQLAEQGLVAHVAPIHEWVYYVNWLIKHRLVRKDITRRELLAHSIRHKVMVNTERRIKRIMDRSGWYQANFIDVDRILRTAEHFISPALRGEAVLTVGGPLAEVGKDYCGAIAIGPFGCMPNRLGESILNLSMDRHHIRSVRHDPMTQFITDRIDNLPFLAIESDGSPFPQVIEARLENFVVQAKRTHAMMLTAGELLNRMG